VQLKTNNNGADKYLPEYLTNPELKPLNENDENNDNEDSSVTVVINTDVPDEPVVLPVRNQFSFKEDPFKSATSSRNALFHPQTSTVEPKLPREGCLSPEPTNKTKSVNVIIEEPRALPIKTEKRSKRSVQDEDFLEPIALPAKAGKTVALPKKKEEVKNPKDKTKDSKKEVEESTQRKVDRVTEAPKSKVQTGTPKPKVDKVTVAPTPATKDTATITPKPKVAGEITMPKSKVDKDGKGKVTAKPKSEKETVPEPVAEPIKENTKIHAEGQDIPKFSNRKISINGNDEPIALSVNAETEPIEEPVVMSVKSKTVLLPKKKDNAKKDDKSRDNGAGVVKNANTATVVPEKVEAGIQETPKQNNQKINVEEAEEGSFYELPVLGGDRPVAMAAKGKIHPKKPKKKRMAKRKITLIVVPWLLRRYR